MAEYSVNKYDFNNNTYLLEDNRLSDSDINKLSTVSGNAAAVTLIDSTSGSPTTTNLSELIINKLTQAQYNALATPDSTQLYLITDDTIYATKTYVDNLITNIDALPSQSGNSGKYLTTNGTTASWATINALPSQSGNSGKFLTTNGTTASWTTPSGTWGISISGNAATATTASSCTGNANTATTLQTARTINGTSFNGSANITTANWGTARTLTIGASGQSINGSANITYTPYAMRLSRALYATDTNPNDFAARGCALGMINLGSNGAVDNPGGATGWHHIISLTYNNCTDNDGNTTNNWCTQIMNPCGGTNLWYRSRSGGSIANGTAWTVPWKHIWIEGNAVTSAVWNDYAEYRETDTQEFGRCVIENGDDTMSLSTQRLQKGCSITSDTWGFAQGQTEKAKTPIAVSGRVLAYPFEDKEEFRKHIGDAVCSGPEGTVSIMTNEEIQKYPLSIIGTISAVPDYEEWGGGSDRDPVKVNGRVWIRIK